VTQPEAPIFPPGRYGHRREGGRSPRLVPLVLVGIAALALIWLTLRLYGQYGAHSYQSTVVRYSDVTDSHVTVMFEVRKPVADTALCRLQAKDRYGAESGYAEVKVGTGGRVTTTYTMATKARAILVDILGCNAAPR
jgi:hypothetical protein